MRLLIASDIHGDAYWCERLVKIYKESGSERLILLGDILYHGPRNKVPEHYDPQKVVSLLNPLAQDILCVRGNCEAEVDQMLLSFPCMAEYMHVLTPHRGWFLTHGHHYSCESLPPMRSGDVFLQGHTHVPRMEVRDGITLLNPGSVSIPKEQSHHSYLQYSDEDGRERFSLISLEDGEILQKLILH